MYRVTVEEINVTEYPETHTVYIKDGKTFSSSYDFEGSPDKKEDRTTGAMLQRKTVEKVFEQH